MSNWVNYFARFARDSRSGLHWPRPFEINLPRAIPYKWCSRQYVNL
jgi:hypothetical protein